MPKCDRISEDSINSSLPNLACYIFEGLCKWFEAHAYTVDLSKKEQINETAQKVKHEVGNVDILINNAGIVTGRQFIKWLNYEFVIW